MTLNRRERESIVNQAVKNSGLPIEKIWDLITILGGGEEIVVSALSDLIAGCSYNVVVETYFRRSSLLH